MPQRGHRNRQRVVGVVLVRSAAAQHPGPGGQGRRDVHDQLVGRDELLREQEAETLGSLDRPSPRWERLGPRQQPTDLISTAAQLQPSEFDLVATNGHRSVRRLVRIDPDDHVHGVPPEVDGDRGGHSYLRIVALIPLPSHTSFESQTPYRAGRRLASDPDETPRRYGTSRTANGSLK